MGYLYTIYPQGQGGAEVYTVAVSEWVCGGFVLSWTVLHINDPMLINEGVWICRARGRDRRV